MDLIVPGVKSWFISINECKFWRFQLYNRVLKPLGHSLPTPHLPNNSQFSPVWQYFHIVQTNLNSAWDWIISLHIKTNLNSFGRYCKNVADGVQNSELYWIPLLIATKGIWLCMVWTDVRENTSWFKTGGSFYAWKRYLCAIKSHIEFKLMLLSQIKLIYKITVGWDFFFLDIVVFYLFFFTIGEKNTKVGRTTL